MCGGCKDIRRGDEEGDKIQKNLRGDVKKKQHNGMKCKDKGGENREYRQDNQREDVKTKKHEMEQNGKKKRQK